MTLKGQAEQLGIKVDGRWSDSRIQEEINKTLASAGDASSRSVDNTSIEGGDVDVTLTDDDNIQMNILANRIWSGQSPDLPKHERMFRVRNGCEAQGFKNLDEIVIDGQS